MEEEYEVAELRALLYTEEFAIDPPRGEDEADELVCGCIWGRPGSFSPVAVDRGAYCELYHDASTGPREWTCEIDGSSSFALVLEVGPFVQQQPATRLRSSSPQKAGEFLESSRR